MTPSRKVTGGALAGGLSIILVWGVKQWGHVDIPAEVASALTVVISFITAYFVPEA